jgi:catechol 2,3-dioxygenase-like lactoylglutathione lyase family enzyme
MMPTVSVRYIVNDVDAAIAFYRDNLGFAEVMHPAPAFAMLSRGDLRLLLSAPGAGPGGGHRPGRIPAGRSGASTQPRRRRRAASVARHRTAPD